VVLTKKLNRGAVNKSVISNHNWRLEHRKLTERSRTVDIDEEKSEYERSVEI